MTNKKRERLYSLYNGHCAYCGKHIGKDVMTADHIIPKSKGGGNADANLLPACKPCNLLKGDKTLEEFRKVFFKAHPHPEKRFYFEIQKVSAAPSKKPKGKGNALIEELLLQNTYLIYCIEHIRCHEDGDSELGFFLQMARKKNIEFKSQYEKNFKV